MSARRVLVNATSLLAGRIFGAVVTVAVAATAANLLDIREFGLVASTLAGGFLANMVVTFGTDTVITRAIAADQADAAVRTRVALRLQLLLALVLATVAFVAWLMGAHVVVPIQAAALVPMAVVTVTGSVLRGVQRMDQLLVGSIAGGAVTLVALGFGFTIERAPWVPVLALALGSLVTAIVLCVFVARLPGGIDDADPSSPYPLWQLTREAAPFGAMVVLAAVGAQIGLLLVEFASDETTGGYGVAVRLTEAARLVPAAAMGAFFPAMLSGLHRTDRYRRWVRWLVLYALAATAALLILAEPINRIVFDDQPGGAVLTRILALGLVVTVARLALSFAMIANHRENVVLMSAAVGATITVVGGLVAVNRFGSQGVAWAQLAGVVAATLVLALRASDLGGDE